MCAKPDDVIGIIPARYGSTRFPGKPLARLAGATMIEHVWRRASEALPRVVVATDDERIVAEVERFGGEAVLTSATCANGTERVLEAYRTLRATESIIVNIQGDEPLVSPADIRDTAALLAATPEASIATTVCRFDPAMGFEALFSPSRVKTVRDARGFALYFSRSIVPYVRDADWQHWLEAYPDFYIHTGLYAFRASQLQQLVALPESPLERAEKLEQLRWLWAGYRIITHLSPHAPHPVDTPADLSVLTALLTAK